MKKIIFLISVVSVIITSSCKKTDNQTSYALIEEARNYFETTVITNKESSSPSTGGLKIPLPEKRDADWNKANIQQLKFGSTVVVPISLPDLYTEDKFKTKQQAGQNAFL